MRQTLVRLADEHNLFGFGSQFARHFYDVFIERFKRRETTTPNCGNASGDREAEAWFNLAVKVRLFSEYASCRIAGYLAAIRYSVTPGTGWRPAPDVG